MKNSMIDHAGIRAVAATLVLALALITGCSDETTAPRREIDPVWRDGLHTAVTEEQFTVADGVLLSVESFTGRVVWRTGEDGVVAVKTTRRAAYREDLGLIEVDVAATAGGLDIVARNPADVARAEADFEITAPADAIPRVRLGVGNIDYAGRPRGVSRFSTGVGSVALALPADVDLSVDLLAAVGSIYCEFPVAGMVTSHPRAISGRIGQGTGGHLSATTAVGSIRLLRR